MTDEHEDNEEKMNTEKRKRAAVAYTEATVFDQEPHHEIGKDDSAEESQESASRVSVMDDDETSHEAEETKTRQKPKSKMKEKDIEKDVENDVAVLQNDLEEALQKANEYFEGWQRERADFANYKKRIEREQSQWTQTISSGIIKKYLVVMDDIERALKAKPSQGEGASWADGIELIYRKLQNILEAEGIQRIEAESMEFDPIYHEAISHEESEHHQSGEIIEVIQQGYTLGERVIRPALVRVAR